MKCYYKDHVSFIPGIIAIALYSMQTENTAILNFNKGDKLVVENNR